jgi:hypothetical protein
MYFPDNKALAAEYLTAALPAIQQLAVTPLAAAVTAAAALSPAQLILDPSAAASPDLTAQMRSDYLELISFAQDVQAALSYAHHRDMTRGFDEIDAARAAGAAGSVGTATATRGAATATSGAAAAAATGVAATAAATTGADTAAASAGAATAAVAEATTGADTAAATTTAAAATGAGAARPKTNAISMIGTKADEQELQQQMAQDAARAVGLVPVPKGDGTPATADEATEDDAERTIGGGVQLCAYAMMPLPVPWPNEQIKRLECTDIREDKLPLEFLVWFTAGLSHHFLPTAPGDSPAGRNVGANMVADKELQKRDTHCWNCGVSADAAAAAGRLRGGAGGGGGRGKGKDKKKPPQLLSCGRCRVAKYCSVECQKEHWKAGHKQACEHLAEAAVRPPEMCPCCGHVMDKETCFKAACRRMVAGSLAVEMREEFMRSLLAGNGEEFMRGLLAGNGEEFMRGLLAAPGEGLGLTGLLEGPEERLGLRGLLEGP